MISIYKETGILMGSGHRKHLPEKSEKLNKKFDTTGVSNDDARRTARAQGFIVKAHAKLARKGDGEPDA